MLPGLGRRTNSMLFATQDKGMLCANSAVLIAVNMHNIHQYGRLEMKPVMAPETAEAPSAYRMSDSVHTVYWINVYHKHRVMRVSNSYFGCNRLAFPVLRCQPSYLEIQ